MCGRFLLYTSLDKLQRAFGVTERPNLQARYNVAPSQTIPIVRPLDRTGMSLRQGPRRFPGQRRALDRLIVSDEAQMPATRGSWAVLVDFVGAATLDDYKR